MKGQLLSKITIPLLLLVASFFVLIVKPATIQAQGATISCFIAFVNFNGSDQPSTTVIPTNTDFNLLITCTSFPTTENVSVTFNGVTKTLNGLTAALNTSFGPWNFSSAYSGGVTFTIPGNIVSCMSTCSITMNGGPVPVPVPPPPTPTPTPGNGISTSSGSNPCITGPGGFCPTAIGNIPISLGDFATAVLRIALGISGGIVLILMVIGSIRVMTSSGDPQRVAAGRDMIVAALAGALFIAFSVMIMQFLGTAIVPIPGLTFGT